MATITFRTKDSGTVAMDQATIDNLKTRIRGAILLPETPGYDEIRSVWNAMIDRKPSVIVRCLGVADIVACVNFAREHDLLLAIKGGGHNIAGLGTCDGGLMMDMSLMRGVWVDRDSGTAHAQPGCLLGDVDRETQIHGLASVMGFISNTGIAGLTLGGGFGYLTSRFGWTSDTVQSMDVVTADGRVVRASEQTNDDLFWALRGGGGNFGVVTNFQYKLYPLGPEIMAGAVAWPGEAAPDVLQMYSSLISNGPPELTIATALRLAPPAPWLPKDIHGKPIIVFFVCDSGPLHEAEKRAAKIKSFGSPVGDILQRRPYVTQQSLIDATQPKGRRYYWKSEYLAGIDTKLLPKLIEYFGRIVSPYSAIILFPIGGALNKLPEDHSAVGNRNASIVLNITGSWERADDDNKNKEWVHAAWQDMRSFSTGGTYINFQTEDEGDARIHAAYGKNYKRLVEIKTKWDPANLFRMNKNVAPRGA